tara:strand:- start:1685 stop:2563 length:879 start_codon:yes stop_codon:yes gene_type:complete
MNLAILGANSLLGSDFVDHLNDNEIKVFLFSRKTNKGHITYDKFNKNKYDVIINFIGAGDPKKIIKEKNTFFETSNYYDELIISYLRNNKKCKFISISSGSVLSNFTDPVNISSKTILNLNNLYKESNPYALTKTYLEIKHRLLKDLNIIDLRVFNYVSCNLEASSSFFIADIMKCLRDNKQLICSPHEFYRDYIGPKDLSEILKCIISSKEKNNVFDAYSKKPTSSHVLLSHLEKEFDLNYKFSEDFIDINATGSKSNYFSKNFSLSSLGYEPEFSSLESISMELKKFLES